MNRYDDDTINYINYLKKSIDASITKYSDTVDYDKFKYLKDEISYIDKIFKENYSLDHINQVRFNRFLETMDDLFRKYLIEEFDFYNDIIKARYDYDKHRKHVDELRIENREKRNQ